jgi:hypothetical protein
MHVMTLAAASEAAQAMSCAACSANDKGWFSGDKRHGLEFFTAGSAAFLEEGSAANAASTCTPIARARPTAVVLPM